MERQAATGQIRWGREKRDGFNQGWIIAIAGLAHSFGYRPHSQGIVRRRFQQFPFRPSLKAKPQSYLAPGLRAFGRGWC